MELKNNRYKLLLLCLVFAFLSRAAFADTGFDDFTEKDWFYEGVLYASSNKLLRTRRKPLLGLPPQSIAPNLSWRCTTTQK